MLAFIKKVILSVMIIIVVLMSLLWLINTDVFDEELDPGVVSLLESQPLTPDRDNGFFLVWGISAENEFDPISAGIQLMQSYRQNLSEKNLDTLTEENYRAVLGEIPEFDKELLAFETCQARKVIQCDNIHSAELPNIADERYQVLLKRFQTIASMGTYKELNHGTIATPIPSYAYLISISQSYLIHLYREKNWDLLVNTLDSNQLLWRKLLDSNGYLITHMIATAGYWFDIKMSQTLLKENVLSLEQITRLQSSMSPLGPKELSLSDSIKLEFRTMFSVIEDLDNGKNVEEYLVDSVPNPFFFQKNATMNESYFNVLQPNLIISEASTVEFIDSISEHQNSMRRYLETNHHHSITGGYNFYGKKYLYPAGYDVSPYIARLHDLNIMLTLVSKVIDQHLMRPSHALDLHRLAKSLNDDFDSRLKVQINESNRLVGFTCLEKSNACQIAIGQ